MGGGKLTPGQVIVCRDCGTEVARTGRNQLRCPPCRDTGRGARDYASRKRRGKLIHDQRRAQSRNHGGVIVPHGSPCQICGVVKPLVVDHDHTCCPSRNSSCGRCVRGFLCRPCNASLGVFGDTPEMLHRAIAYLEGRL